MFGFGKWKLLQPVCTIHLSVPSPRADLRGGEVDEDLGMPHHRKPKVLNLHQHGICNEVRLTGNGEGNQYRLGLYLTALAFMILMMKTETERGPQPSGWDAP